MKNYWGLIILILIIAAAYITNPKEDDFKEFISSEIVKDANKGKVKGENFEGFQEQLIEGFMDFFTDIKIKNYEVCSVFSVVDLSGNKKKFLGIFTLFIPLN
jgi:hypothetical protein